MRLLVGLLRGEGQVQVTEEEVREEVAKMAKILRVKYSFCMFRICLLFMHIFDFLRDMELSEGGVAPGGS